MARFRKKPVVIEAFQLGIDYIPDWFMDKVTTNDIILHGTSSGFEHHDDINADIKTLEGWHHANFGDFIIKGTAGEIYPCKPHIFKDIYESADTTADVAPKSEAVSEMDYMSSAIEKIIIERNKTVDSAILGEIQKIAVENGIEAKIVLNEKNVADALRNYQDGYAAIKREVAREIKAFEKKVGQIYNHYVFEDADYADDDVAIEAVINALTEVLNELAELEKKYTEGGEQ